MNDCRNTLDLIQQMYNILVLTVYALRNFKYTALTLLGTEYTSSWETSILFNSWRMTSLNALVFNGKCCATQVLKSVKIGLNTTRILEMLGHFLNLIKWKLKEFQIPWANILFTIEHREHNKCLNWELLQFYAQNELISNLMPVNRSQNSWDGGMFTMV